MNFKKQKLNNDGNAVCKVRFGDLLKSISKVSGVNIMDMNYSISFDVCYPGKYNLLEVVNLMDKDKKTHLMLVSIIGSRDLNNVLKVPFYYNFYFPIDLTKIQSNGKKLFNYCYTNSEYNFIDGSYYTYLKLDNNILDIILEFKLKDLLKPNSIEQYPMNLLINSISDTLENYEKMSDTKKYILKNIDNI